MADKLILGCFICMSFILIMLIDQYKTISKLENKLKYDNNKLKQILTRLNGVG